SLAGAQTRLSTQCRRSDSTWLFGAFALLLAFALILHQLWWDGFEVRSPHFFVILAALWTVLRPTSVVRFLTMIATEVLAVALDMPEVGSHTLLLLVSGVSVLTWVAWFAFRAHRMPDAGVLFEQIAPFFAVELLLVYAVAAVAKLNTGFFDPDISCAASMSGRLPWSNLSILAGSWRVVASIWGTVVVEVALPILLTVRRSRPVGLVLGGVFHAVLGLAGNVPFSALALALFVTFLPPDAPSRLFTLAATRPGLVRWASRTGRMSRSVAAFPVAVGCWLAGAALFPDEPGTGKTLLSEGMELLMVAAFAGGILVVLGLARRGSQSHSARSLRVHHSIFVAGILLMVLNSVSPYVGLKTESSLTMFSNLQTEGGQWNHLLIPEAVRVFPYQDDPVRVLASNDPALDAQGHDGVRLVPFELERHLRSHPGTVATYATTDALGVKVLTAGPGADAAPLTRRFLDKIVKFQPVPPPGRGGC
ncbi:MAG: hypothetical protein M3450_02945, partial [Actinomycetota bacterium]|nr:hypothetical protein [Actinomycetota bacterium]